MNKLGKSLPPLASILPFEAAARLGSFSKAAEELHITQAAISRQIRLLEEDLGIALFERRNRAVFLTNAGQAFHATLSHSLGDIAIEAERLRGHTDENEVTLLCQATEGFYWLMPRLSSFHQRHPDIEMKVATLTRPLAEYGAHFDIAMQSSDRDHGAHSLLFCASDEVFPVCSPGYVERCGRPAELSELRKHTLLHHQTTPAFQLEWDTWLAEFDVPYPKKARSLTFDSYSLMFQAAVAGHGLAIGWRRTAQSMLDNASLVAPFEQSVALPNALSVFGRHGSVKREAVRYLEAWLREELA
jgi:LysR family transcriptional regulator, glycine cleavage system transcriptional activator